MLAEGRDALARVAPLLFGGSRVIPMFLLNCVDLVKFHPLDNSSQFAVAAGQSTVCSITPKLLLFA